MIPFLDLKPALTEIADEGDAAIRRVIASGCFLGGDEVIAFEEEWAAYCNAPYCVAFASGTDALAFACYAAQFTDASVPANTCHFTAVAVRRGIQICFRNRGDPCWTIDVDDAGSPIYPPTIPVLLYGIYPQPSLPKYVRVVDACQAHGWKQNRNTMSIAAWSFYPTKNLGTFGDGGAVTCASVSEWALFRELSATWHSRMSEINAAMLRVKLRHLDRWNLERRMLAEVYWNELPNTVWSVCRPGAPSNHHIFAVTCNRRDDLRKHLSENGVGTKIHYPVPVAENMPGAQRWSERVLSLPCYPGMTKEQVLEVCDVIRSFA